jgi:cytochrome b
MKTKAPEKVLVWDAPVRLFHWLMVLCFAGAYLSADSERWRLIHVTLGYTMAGLVLFRIVWGLVGTRYARFASFVPGPAQLWHYLRAAARGQPTHSVGHNPAGAVGILLILLTSTALVVSGWAVYNDLAGEWLSVWHERIATLMLGLVFLHLLGVASASLMHRERLVRAMITGYKTWPEAVPGTGSLRRGVALLLLMAVLGYWCLQWWSAP